MKTDGIDGWSTEDQKTLLISQSQEYCDFNFSEYKNETQEITSFHAGHIEVSNLSPFSPFHPKNYSEFNSQLLRGVPNLSMEPVSPKSLSFSVTPSFRLDTMGGVMKLDDSNGLGKQPFNERLSQSRVNNPLAVKSTEEYRVVHNNRREDVDVRQPRENKNVDETIAIDHRATNCFIQSGEAFNHSRTFETFQPQTDGLSSEITSLINSFFGETAPTLISSTANSSSSLAKSTIRASPDRPGLCLQTDMVSDPVGSIILKGNHLERPDQMSENLPPLVKSFLPSIRASLYQENQKLRKDVLQIEEKLGVPVTSGMDLLDLPRISHATTSSTSGLRVQKRKLSDEELEEILISCHARKFKQTSSDSRAKFCHEKPLLIPSIPLVPEISTLKINLATFNRRYTKNLVLKKRFKVSS